MATKVKPSRLNVTGTPQVGNVPVYVDEDTFSWGAGGGGGSGDVSGPASSTDGDVAIFDGPTGKLIKDGSIALSTLSSAASLASTAIQPGDDISDLNNDSGFITGITSGDVTTALGYTPYNSSNPSGYITSADIPTDVSDFNNDAGYLTSTTGVTSFNGNSGAITYTAPVTSVNGSTGAVTVNEFAPGGTATTGYVVTKTASGYEWQAPTGGIEVDSASPIQLTKIWAGTQAQYDALGSYDSTTVYLTI